jgi:hypothetical protein
VSRYIFFTFLISLISVIFLVRCANPVSPQGGPKDVSPPEVVKADPPNYSVHFTGNEIQITFDEFIQLKEPLTRVTISPPYLPNTDYHLRGKIVQVRIEDSLRKNTTYSINFGESILDITENNILKDYSYIFSTGPYVDSLSLEGSVADAFTAQPQAGVLALLYVDDNDTIPFDSLPLLVPPFYRARTDENGLFRFHHIQDKPFLLFAVKDLNGNAYFDQPGEKIAFCDSLVKGSYSRIQKTDTTVSDSLITKDSLDLPTPGVPFFNLRLFEESDSVQRIQKAFLAREGQVSILFRFPSENTVFEPIRYLPEDPWMIPEFSRNRDTVSLWLVSFPHDSLVLAIHAKGMVTDTVELDLTKSRSKKKVARPDEQKPAALQLKNNIPDGKLNLFRFSPVITCSYPLAKWDFSKARIVDGNDTLLVALVIVDSVKRRILVDYPWKEDRKYQVILPDSILTSVNGLANDSLVWDFKTRSTRDFGSIQVVLSHAGNPAPLIVQLLSGEKDAVIMEKIVPEPARVGFEYLLPGKYRIRLISDRNRNGRWDTGNYHIRLQPEEVFYFPKTIEVRANWDIEETWEY